jgi:hypothetical protein
VTFTPREGWPDGWRRRGPLIRKVVGGALALAGTAFLVSRVLAEWDEIRSVSWQFGWLTFLAVACVMIGQALIGQIVFTCLRYTRARAHPGRVIGIYLVSQAAKYLPVGGLVNISTQTVLLSRLDGVGLGAGMFAVGTGLVIVICAGISTFGLASLADAGAAWYMRLAIFALPVAVAALRSRWLWSIVARVLPRRLGDRLGARDASHLPPLRATVLLAALGLAAWVALGGSLALIAAEVTSVSPAMGIRLCGLMAVSWVAGVLSVGVPAGLGVRDSILMLLLQRVLPSPWPVTVPIVSRLVWVAADLLNLIPGALLNRSALTASRNKGGG